IAAHLLFAVGFGTLGAQACSNDSSVVSLDTDAGTDSSVGDTAVGCPTGTTMCGSSCVETKVDPSNCGACGTACTSDQVCSAGTCALTCAGGTTKCGSSCLDTNVDPKNCGSCGNACTAGQVCNAGSCAATCSPGLVQCGASCIDPMSNLTNCGATAGCG